MTQGPFPIAKVGNQMSTDWMRRLTQQGKWAPGFRWGGSGGSGGTAATASSTGHYYKIGNLVFIRYVISLNTKGTNTGFAWLTGLPFAATSSDGLSGVLPIGDLQWAGMATTWVNMKTRGAILNTATGLVEAALFGATAATTIMDTGATVSFGGSLQDTDFRAGVSLLRGNMIYFVDN